MNKNIKPYIPLITTLFNGITRDFTAFGSFVFLLILILILTTSFSEAIFLYFGLVLLELLCAAIKVIGFKHRPIQESYSNLIEKINASSFPSNHTARAAFVNSYFFIKYIGDLKGVIFLFIILIVALTRIWLKRHYVIDVITGFLVGISFYILYTILVSI